MKLTLQTQLFPDAGQAARLRATVERFNEAANWLAGIAFDRKVSNKIVLQKLAYRELRECFQLPADTAVRCIAQVCEAYKRDQAKRPTFGSHAAVPFSMGKNIGFKGPDRVSISTLNGRVVVPFVMGKYQGERFGFAKGQSDLVLRGDGKWFLLVTVDVPDGIKPPATDFIGIDLGIENIAADSDGERHSGKDVEAKRFAYASRRRALGRKSKGAARRARRRIHKAIKRGERRESRYRRDVNHRISKQVVAKAKDTGRGIAVEDLSGITGRTRFRKPQRFRLGGWAFSQLRQYLAYKATLAGVELVAVDPRDTSKTRNVCGHCDRANRKTQAEFRCVRCGHQAHADLNAARNIRDRARASVNAPQGSERQHAGYTGPSRRLEATVVDSPLSVGAAGAIHGGDRLPWVETEPGQDNFAPLASIAWQVHVYGEAAGGVAEACAERGLPLHVFAWRPDMRRSGLRRGALYLVRPDGYVGLADPRADPERLRQYRGDSRAEVD